MEWAYAKHTTHMTSRDPPNNSVRGQESHPHFTAEAASPQRLHCWPRVIKYYALDRKVGSYFILRSFAKN